MVKLKHAENAGRGINSQTPVIVRSILVLLSPITNSLSYHSHRMQFEHLLHSTVRFRLEKGPGYIFLTSTDQLQISSVLAQIHGRTH